MIAVEIGTLIQRMLLIYREVTKPFPDEYPNKDLEADEAVLADWAEKEGLAGLAAGLRDKNIHVRWSIVSTMNTLIDSSWLQQDINPGLNIIQPSYKEEIVQANLYDELFNEMSSIDDDILPADIEPISLSFVENHSSKWPIRTRTTRYKK